MSFDFNTVPAPPGLRWFVRHGTEIRYDRGFRSKAEASVWINNQGHALDWRAGFLFRLKGVSLDMAIVNRNGDIAA